LYLIGEAPGYNEDQKGVPWVGKAGRILQTLYLDYFWLPDKVDVFLSNAVRCRPPGNKKPTKSQLKACQGFYLADIVYLQKLYDQVIVLCCGAPAVQSVLGMSLKKSFTRQGGLTDFRALTAPTPKSIVRVGEVVGPYLDDPTLPPFPRPCPVFTTYHPAAVGRDKNKGLFVGAHLKLLVDYLKGDLTYDIKGGSLTIQMAPPPPDYVFSQLSLDIETYGILKGQNQTQFHPLKSVVHDGIPPEKLVVTVGLTWRSPDTCESPSSVENWENASKHQYEPHPGELKHAIFIMSKEKHRRRLWSWIKKCYQEAGLGALSTRDVTKVQHTHSGPFKFLVGQNLKFDLMYLRHAYPECKTWLNYPLPIVDLTVTNYLLNEGRPEKSLKALAPLLKVTQYQEGFTQHTSPESVTLHQYNCQDTAATLLAHAKLEELIGQLYTKDTPKLSVFNREWYSKLLWMTVWMEEAGIAMNRPALEGLLKSYKARMVKLEKGIKSRWDINLRGKGSEKHKRNIMDQACHTLLQQRLPVPKLEKTKEKHEISFKEENRNILLDVLPVESRSSRQLAAVGRVHAVGGVLDRYLYPLLVGRGKNHTDPTTCLINGLAFPRWYPVPSEYEDGGGGGTKQCRIVAKGPPVQTFPPQITDCITSRYSYLVWFDYSQIELRIAALLSNDPWMMEEYSKPDCDFHLGTARKLFGETDAKKFRQIGKVLNFLVIYLGGAGQFQTTLMRDVGIARSRGQCQKDIDSWWKQAQGLHQWQEETFEFVCKHGYFQLPLVGQSRLFLGNRSEVRDQMKEIVNMPVQSVAANIMLSAQFELQWTFMQKRMKAILPLNVYDAASIEFPKPELYAVKRELERILPNPPYYQALCEVLGRRLPLEYDMKIIEVAT
jgi:uracil-DNA glycosylase family 4